MENLPSSMEINGTSKRSEFRDSKLYAKESANGELVGAEDGEAVIETGDGRQDGQGLDCLFHTKRFIFYKLYTIQVGIIIFLFIYFKLIKRLVKRVLMRLRMWLVKLLTKRLVMRLC